MASSALLRHMQAALAAHGWSFTEVEGREVLRAAFGTPRGAIDVVVQIHEPLRAASVVAELPDRPGPQHRAKAAELLMRTNLLLTVGNFELDWDTGRVFFRTTNLFGPEVPPPALLAGLVDTAVGEADRLSGFVHELAGSPPADLPRFDVPRLMRREDLLPEPTPGKA